VINKKHVKFDVFFVGTAFGVAPNDTFSPKKCRSNKNSLSFCYKVTSWLYRRTAASTDCCKHGPGSSPCRLFQRKSRDSRFLLRRKRDCRETKGFTRLPCFFVEKTRDCQTKTYVFVWEAPIKSRSDFIEARSRMHDPARRRIKRDWRAKHVTVTLTIRAAYLQNFRGRGSDTKCLTGNKSGALRLRPD